MCQALESYDESDGVPSLSELSIVGRADVPLHLLDKIKNTWQRNTVYLYV